MLSVLQLQHVKTKFHSLDRHDMALMPFGREDFCAQQVLSCRTCRKTYQTCRSVKDCHWQIVPYTQTACFRFFYIPGVYAESTKY